MRLAAVIPAAGMSRRMGAFKPLLQIAGKPVLLHILQTLRAAGVSEIALVTGYKADALRALPVPCALRLAHNAAYANTGMLESVQLGLAALFAGAPFSDAYFLLPADMPALRPQTLVLLQDAYAAANAPLIRPAYQGLHGHPPLLSPAAARDVLGHTGGTLREALHSLPHQTAETNDPGILLGLNTPEDFKRIKRFLHERSW